MYNANPRRVRRNLAFGIGVLSAIALGLSGCSSPSTPAEGGEDQGGAAVVEALQMESGELNFDLAKYCGEKPMKIGNITGFGGNSWMQSVRAIIDGFQETCPNITEVQYFDANGEVSRYNDTINAWAAQGFDVVYAFTGSFGTQTLPVFRTAQQAGMVIGASNIPLGDDAVPSTVTASVVQDQQDMADQYVEFFDSAKDEGPAKILLIGGTPGNTLDPGLIEKMKLSIEETGAEVEFLQEDPIVGNWDIATSAQAAASVIPKYEEIDGILLTNAAVAPAVMRAFVNADRPIPALGGTGITSGTICEIQELRETDPSIQMLSLDGTGNVGPLALAKAIAAFQEIDAPELGPSDAETYVKLARYVDTINGVMPECDPSLPADADPTMALSAEEIIAAVG